MATYDHSSASQHKSQQRIERIAWLLDASIPVPGTRWRIGFDGLVGLIPGIGDLLTSGVSGYIILQASKMGVPTSVLVRMMLNVALELVIGSIPLIGDLFDFFYKANLRNVELVREYREQPQNTVSKSRWELFITGALLIGLSVAVIWLGVMLLGALLNWIGATF